MNRLFVAFALLFAWVGLAAGCATGPNPLEALRIQQIETASRIGALERDVVTQADMDKAIKAAEVHAEMKFGPRAMNALGTDTDLVAKRTLGLEERVAHLEHVWVKEMPILPAPPFYKGDPMAFSPGAGQYLEAARQNWHAAVSRPNVAKLWLQDLAKALNQSPNDIMAWIRAHGEQDDNGNIKKDEPFWNWCAVELGLDRVDPSP